jgi:hypothetical protein
VDRAYRGGFGTRVDNLELVAIRLEFLRDEANGVRLEVYFREV